MTCRSGTSASSASTSAARTSSRATCRTRRSRWRRSATSTRRGWPRVGDEFGIAGRTKSFDDLLADPAIDIIDICTPPLLHRPQVEAALAAGKHVVCEKPLTGSLADCDAIIAAEKGAKGVLMPIFQYRYGDGVEKAKRIIDAGIAGKLYVGSVETFWKRTPDYYAVPWRGKWASELGGVLVTHALHLHDMALLARRARRRGCSAGSRRGSTTSRSRTAPAPAC